jgi:hypothetical protein
MISTIEVFQADSLRFLRSCEADKASPQRGCAPRKSRFIG